MIKNNSFHALQCVCVLCPYVVRLLTFEKTSARQQTVNKTHMYSHIAGTGTTDSTEERAE